METLLTFFIFGNADMNDLLKTLYDYNRWANEDLLGKLALVDPVTQADARHTAIRLVDHFHVVANIFAAHLSGTQHGYASDNTPDTPSLEALRVGVAATDRWYRDYVAQVTDEALAERVAFTFTDGDRGSMTRQEMLLHVALHAAIHRGEVCRLLVQLSVSPPWDTLAVYLHQAEPSRRAEMKLAG